jgi:hypothetical protein
MSLRYQLQNFGEDFIQPVQCVVRAVIRILNHGVLRLEDGVEASWSKGANMRFGMIDLEVDLGVVN